MSKSALRYALPRIDKAWEEDNSVSKCRGCNADFGYFNRKHHCLPKGTPITLPSGGCIPIERVTNQTLVVWDKTQDIIRYGVPNATLNKGKKVCLEIQLDNGNKLTVTKNHKVLTVDRENFTYVKAKNLKPNMYLVASTLQGKNCANSSTSLNVDIMLAGTRIIGFTCGKNSPYSFDNYTDAQAFWDDVNLSLERYHISPLEMGHVSYDVEVPTQLLTPYLKIPDMIYSAEDHIIYEFLASYDGDTLTEEFAKLLSKVNLSLENYRDCVGWRYTSTKQRTQHMKEVYKYRKLQIPFSKFLESQKRDLARGFYRTKIISIDRYNCGIPTEVWDISVPSYNSFVAYGIVVHNCRVCGKIFCNKCSSHRDEIPEDLKSQNSKNNIWEDYYNYIASVNPNTERVCGGCHHIIQDYKAVSQMVHILKFLPLTIKDLKILGQTCKNWLYATNYILTIFRNIQFKLPNERITQFEERLLLQNREYVTMHNKFYTQLLKVNHTLVNDVTYKIPCWIIKCNKKNCSKELHPFDYIDLMTYACRYGLPKLLDFACDNIRLSSEYLECFIPLFVYFIRFDENLYVVNYLLQKCDTKVLITKLYWELQPHIDANIHANYSIIHEQLLYSDPYQRTQLFKGEAFVKLVKGCTNKHTRKFQYSEPVECPLNPDMKIEFIHLEGTKVKNSYTQPTVVPNRLSNGDLYEILYKKENVRRDQLVISIFKLINIIVREECGIDLDIVTYNILPLDKDSGLVEIVSDCDTIYSIQKKGITILNYILENNDNTRVGDLKERFVKTVAACCVITYLLGIGDRHLDNIMIKKDGRVFHIDFGYILGDEPGIRSPGIRMTSSIVDAIGGCGSKHYPRFKELCSLIYNCLRKHMNVFLNFMLLLPKLSNLPYTEEQIVERLTSRFLPSNTDSDADFHLIAQLENSSGFRDMFGDILHTHSKEQTINAIATGISESVMGWVDYFKTK